MSIVEVAQLAGVSKSTVSRVINDAPGVGESLRAKVLSAMKELDYQPSPTRPGPKPGSRRAVKSGNVVLLVAGLEASEIYRLPIFPDILHGVELALADAGMNLVVSGIRPDGRRPVALSQGQCQGVLLIGSFDQLSPGVLQMLEATPTVGLLRTFEQMDGHFDRAIYNNYAVGPLAAAHLRSLGHVHGAFLDGTLAKYVLEPRRAGFAQSMAEAGGEVVDLSFDPEADDPHAHLGDQINEMKKRMPAVTCMCVSNDGILPQLYSALRAQGIEPQKDIEIVSCDNDAAVLNTLVPRPSSIDIRPECIGRLAIRQLQWRLTNPHDEGPVTVSVQPKLVPAG